MFRWSRVVLVSMAFGVVCAGGAWAEVPGDRAAPADKEFQELKRRAEDRGSDLRESMREISAVGADVRVSQARVDRMRGRIRQIGDQAFELQRQLDAQGEGLAEAREVYENRARAAYKGDDVSGVISMLGQGTGEASIVSDVQMADVLARGRDDIEQYEDARQNLRNSMRQLDHKKQDYSVLVKEERKKAGRLQARELRLDRAISRISKSEDLIRKRMEKRLRELEAAERADRIRKPVSGGTEEVAREKEIQTSRRFAGMGNGMTSEPVEQISEERYMQLYRQTAGEYGFGEDWYVLAAVGKIESDHGKNLGPSTSGAMGPMQFLPSTWSTAGVDGDGDGERNIMDPEDAIPAAAGYLREGGAPADWPAALYTYNHSSAYVKEVLGIAEVYRQQAGDKKPRPYI